MPYLPATVSAVEWLPASLNLHVYRHDSWAFGLVVTDDEGAARDLTGAILFATARVYYDATFSHSLGVRVVSASTGEVEVYSLANAEMLDSGVWDLQATWPSGAVETLYAGLIIVDGDTTFAEPTP